MKTERKSKNDEAVGGITVIQTTPPPIPLILVMILVIIMGSIVYQLYTIRPYNQANPTTHGCRAFNLKNNCSTECPVSFKANCIKDDRTGVAFCYCEEDPVVKTIRDYATIEVKLENAEMNYANIKSDITGFIHGLWTAVNNDVNVTGLKLFLESRDFLSIKDDPSIKKEFDELFQQLK